MPDFLKLDARCIFYPYEGSSAAEEFLMRTPKGRQFRLSPLAKEILESLDGNTSLETIAERLQSRNIPIAVDQLQNFLESEYGCLEIFAGCAPVPPPTEQLRKSPIPIFLHWRLLPARFVSRIGRALNGLFNRFVVLAGVLAIAGSHYWIYRSELPAVIDDEAPINLLLVTLLALVSVLCHEFGHASAVTRYGGAPGPIGFGLYALMPAFYTDVSEVWRFPRRQRMVVDWAGIYFQQLVFCLFAALSYKMGVPEFAIACTLVDAMTLLTLNPVFQFDGYWFLVDFLGLPDLHRLAWMQIKRWLLRSKQAPALPTMRGHGHLIFIAYTVGFAGFVGLLLFLEYRAILLPSTRFFLALPKWFHAVTVAVQAREFLKIANYLLGLLYLIVIPLSAFLGVSMYVIRIYRYFSRHASMNGPSSTASISESGRRLRN